MKKTALLLFSLIALEVSAQQNQGQHVILSGPIIHNGTVGPIKPKVPVQPPYVTYQDYTLFIWGEHAGYTLTLLDDNESVVYQTYIPAGTQTVSLPESLSGSYTLQLSNDSYLFTGDINL